jgi:hypothetical protein
LAETVDVVFWATNADATRLEYIGPAFRQIAGDEARLDDPAPALMLDVFAADDRRTLVEAISQLQTEGGVSRSSCRCRAATVAGAGCASAAFRCAKPGCEVSRIVGFFEDVTEHKLAEDALRDSEAKLRTLFNHSPDLIFTVDWRGQHPAHQPAPAVSGRRCRREAIGTDSAARRSGRLPAEAAAGFQRADESSIASTTSSDATWWEVRMVPISFGEAR